MHVLHVMIWVSAMTPDSMPCGQIVANWKWEKSSKIHNRVSAEHILLASVLSSTSNSDHHYIIRDAPFRALVSLTTLVHFYVDSKFPASYCLPCLPCLRFLVNYPTILKVYQYQFPIKYLVTHFVEQRKCYVHFKFIRRTLIYIVFYINNTGVSLDVVLSAEIHYCLLRWLTYAEHN